MKWHNKRIVIFMPARNTGHLLEKTFTDIPEGFHDEIILVDNASEDDTVEVAKRLGMTVIKHAENRGYGGSLKTGYTAALESGADIVVMLHSDYQYDPRMLPEMVQPILDEQADAVLGSRLMGGHCLQGGMPWWKYIANVGLTNFINLSVGGNLAEYQTGYRAFSSDCLKRIPYHRNSNDFLFDMEILVQILRSGQRIVSIPIPTRYMKGVSTMTFKQCMRYGFGVLRCLAGYWAHRLHFKPDSKYDPLPASAYEPPASPGK